jgi:hypothetical protein
MLSLSSEQLETRTSPYINRFVQPDTIIPDLSNPQSWNRYSYVTNRPVVANDPTGHMMTQEDRDSRPTPPVSPPDDNSSHNHRNGDDWMNVQSGSPDDIFDDMADEDDIAFNYPLDGCFARAQIMQMRILQRYGILPSKIWAIMPDRIPGLSVDTDTMYGKVSWTYHVAPLISVQQPDGSIDQFVIDPSIADGPLSVDEWKGKMHTPENASIQTTSFWQAPIDPDRGKQYEGNGYWTGKDPDTYGGINGYSDAVMQSFSACGAAGTWNCYLPAPYK